MNELPEVAIEVQGLNKAYGSCVANRDVSFSIRRGTIHAIVGENGAGKSTAMKQLYGLVQPDAGTIRVQGKTVSIASPREARTLGIGMVHQHFRLSQPHTALENVILSETPSAFSFLKRARVLQELRQLSQSTGLHVDWEKPIEELPIGVQQRIEILKVLRQKADVLILDEPTAVLIPSEVDELFLRLKELARSGKTILVVTHKLREVMQFSDYVTVFRQGAVVGTSRVSDVSIDQLGQWMVGREVRLLEQPHENIRGRGATPVLSIQNLSEGKLKNLSFDLFPGEIIGIAGVEGNGQKELIQALMFPKKAHSKDSRHSIIPEDRHREGLLMDEDLAENFMLGLQRHADFSKNGILKTQVIQEKTRRMLDEWDVRPRDGSLTPRNLSGGNQQKVIIGREFYRDPKWMIAAQPTRGVDIGAIELIHNRLLGLRDQGCGILLISSELDEIFALSDRILVLFDGRIVAQKKRSEWDRRAMGAAMGGALI